MRVIFKEAPLYLQQVGSSIHVTEVPSAEEFRSFRSNECNIARDAAVHRPKTQFHTQRNGGVRN